MPAVRRVMPSSGAMDIWDWTLHLANFVAPALGVAACVAALAVRGRPQPLARWWRLVALHGVLGTGVLAAGLWWFGRDGKIATYGALVAAVALGQWLVDLRSAAPRKSR